MLLADRPSVRETNAAALVCFTSEAKDCAYLSEAHRSPRRSPCRPPFKQAGDRHELDVWVAFARRQAGCGRAAEQTTCVAGPLLALERLDRDGGGSHRFDADDASERGRDRGSEGGRGRGCCAPAAVAGAREQHAARDRCIRELGAIGGHGACVRAAVLARTVVVEGAASEGNGRRCSRERGPLSVPPPSSAAAPAPAIRKSVTPPPMSSSKPSWLPPPPPPKRDSIVPAKAANTPSSFPGFDEGSIAFAFDALVSEDTTRRSRARAGSISRRCASSSPSSPRTTCATCATS